MGGLVAAKQGLIFFDITLLALRAGYKTPTGVARVELAYAFEMLNRYPDRVRFLVALQRMVQIVPNAVARRYLEATEKAWRAMETVQSHATIQRIAKFLGVDSSCFHSGAPTGGSQSNKVLLAADLMARAAFSSLLPRGLGQFSKSADRNVYIHVSGSNVPSAWIERWLARSPSVDGIFMLHDVIPLTHPEYVRNSVPLRHAKYVRRIANVASVIVANSTFTADSLARFADESHMKMPHTVVAPLGIGRVFERGVEAKPGMPPYFVFVSTIEPRKNHIMLLQVWSRLVDRFGDKAPKLVLVGRRGWENENIIDLLERAHTSGQHVLECQGLCDETLAALIRNARATLMPSHVEGYGLPVAESLALGTPVICSDLPPFRESAGEIPEYVDPLAGRGWAKVIMEYAQEDSEARRAQLDRLRGFGRPTWRAHFDTVEGVIDLLSARPETITKLAPQRSKPAVDIHPGLAAR
jgi:glycosyltransferase involved in cell wall biosynthesis